MVPRKITNNKKSSNTAKYKAQSSSKKGKTNGSFTVFKTVATVFVVFLLLFLATETFGVATLSSMSDSVKSFVASLKSGEGYPYQISSSSVKNIDMMSNNVFLLTDSATISLDSTAKEVAKINHTYASPAMSIQGGRAVVYDRGGYRYMVQSRTEKLFEG